MSFTLSEVQEAKLFLYDYDPVHDPSRPDVISLTLENVFLWITKTSPTAKDRGNYHWNVEVKNGRHAILKVDTQDCFPRYMFNFSHMIWEILEWIKVRPLCNQKPDTGA